VSTRSIVPALAVVLALLSLTAPAYAHESRGDSTTRSVSQAVLPTPAAAQSIVRTLWFRREVALAQSDPSTIDTFATASAKAHDLTYMRLRRCRCEKSIGEHPIDEVVLQIPKASIRPVFFAEVHTTNASSGLRVWYVVAVEHVRSGAWKFAFVSWGGSGEDATAPFLPFTKSSEYTPPVTAEALARIQRQAKAVVHANPTTRTKEGVVIRSRGTMGPQAEGVYGVPLPSGQVISCFTWHVIGTYTYPGGVLVQRAAKLSWGPLIKPGTYASITLDNAMAECTVGTGKPQPEMLFADAPRVVAASGVRA
jgi:hypothetical protein